MENSNKKGVPLSSLNSIKRREAGDISTFACVCLYLFHFFLFSGEGGGGGDKCHLNLSILKGVFTKVQVVSCQKRSL